MTVDRIYISLGGQDDNIGDSILRRRLLTAVRTPGVSHQVFVGSHGPGYIAGLGVRDDDVLHRNFRAWRLRMLRDVAAGRGRYVHNAGEIQLTRSRARNAAFEWLINSAARARRAPSVFAGVGIRHPDQHVPRIIEQSLRSFALVSWRDHESMAATGIGEVAPDWAFGLAPQFDGDPMRTLLALSFRADRPELSDVWVNALSRAAELLGLTPVVVTQVRRDSERSRALAERLGCEHVMWTSDDHPTQERLVREVYARTAVVVSDRLHALIVGATEGASPVGLATAPDKKLRRTLAAGGYADRVAGPAVESVEAGARALLERVEEAELLNQRRADAFGAVARLESRMKALVDGRPIQPQHMVDA